MPTALMGSDYKLSPLKNTARTASDPAVIAAREYLKRGWRPVPVPPDKKNPILKDWPALRLAEDNLLKALSGQNVGLLLGEPSGGLVDVDLDSSEALVLAGAFLPPTERIHGRPSKLRSHWWYIAIPAPKSGKYQDPDGTILVEMRSTGQQTLVPPSTHPEGEHLVWDADGDPAAVSPQDLQRATGKLAAACLLVRRWKKDVRHDAALALAGGLLRNGWSVEETEEFISAVAEAAQDEEAGNRVRGVQDTAKKLKGGAAVIGFPKLTELLGKDVMERVFQWLGLRQAATASTASSDEAVYHQGKNGLIWLKPTKDGLQPVRLTNFAAKIIKDVCEDDGTETRRAFEIDASLRDRRVRFEVLGEKFASLAWVTEHLGAQAIIYPNPSVKDHTRVAIQTLSGDVPRRTVFTHTGWRQIEGQWAYLHGGGAIGSGGAIPGVEVRLPSPLRGFILPDPPEGENLKAAVRASLRMVTAARSYVSVPLLGAIYRAVLGGTDFSLHESGKTGVGKTELAALAQQHWGPTMDARHLPASWLSTGNALEGLAFAAKDALLVVDDFAPHGSIYDVQKFHKEADRLFRAQGNAAGRGRMRSDTTLRPPKPPRGLIISTGEDIPQGQSLRARLLVTEVSPDAVRWNLLSACQQEAKAGLYAQAMAGFVRWVAGKHDKIQDTLRSQVSKLRETAASAGSHRRTPVIIADLAGGWSVFLRFAIDVGAGSKDQARNIYKQVWQVLQKAASEQARHQDATDPARRFLELLATAIASGRAHVESADDTTLQYSWIWGWREESRGKDTVQLPKGTLVGWLHQYEVVGGKKPFEGEVAEKNDLYLEPESAYAVVQQMAKDSGTPITIGSQTLRKRLHEAGMLKSIDEARETLTVRRTLRGAVRNVLHLNADAVAERVREESDAKTDEPPIVPEEGREADVVANDPLPEEGEKLPEGVSA